MLTLAEVVASILTVGVALCAVAVLGVWFESKVRPSTEFVGGADAEDHGLTVDSVTRGSDGTAFTFEGEDGVCQVRFELRGRARYPVGDCPT